ncbi:hypothetical protein JTB14_013048 [Gonioctena quinquepunctata]|nr:hypothetical protein JTB14_013048 [Gonioctena quinquepunctata]
MAVNGWFVLDHWQDPLKVPTQAEVSLFLCFHQDVPLCLLPCFLLSSGATACGNLVDNSWILIKRGQREAEVRVFSCASIKISLTPFFDASCYRLVPCLWKFGRQSFEFGLTFFTRNCELIPVCLDVCRGDALLKKMLREGIRMEKAAFDAMMNPRLAVSISRVGDKKGMFSQNAVKTSS